MTAPPSFTSSYRDPYDAVDSLPEYPLQEDANESSKSPLLRGDQKKKGEQVPLEVDGFAYEVSSCLARDGPTNAPVLTTWTPARPLTGRGHDPTQRHRTRGCAQEPGSRLPA